MSDEALLRRLRRLEQQIRSFRDLHVSEVSEIARKLTAISQLQADELQLILDELDVIVGEAGTAAAAPEVSTSAPVADPQDPAAASPKRAKWLAEQEPRSPVSRRELLLGRGEKGSEPSSS
jgi:hypothetical protein